MMTLLEAAKQWLANSEAPQWIFNISMFIMVLMTWAEIVMLRDEL